MHLPTGSSLSGSVPTGQYTSASRSRRARPALADERSRARPRRARAPRGRVDGGPTRGPRRPGRPSGAAHGAGTGRCGQAGVGRARSGVVGRRGAGPEPPPRGEHALRRMVRGVAGRRPRRRRSSLRMAGTPCSWTMNVRAAPCPSQSSPAEARLRAQVLKGRPFSSMRDPGGGGTAFVRGTSPPLRAAALPALGARRRCRDAARRAARAGSPPRRCA